MRVILIGLTGLALLGGNMVQPDLLHCEPDYEEMADRITARVTKQLVQEYGFVPTGFGGSMMEKVNRVTMMFDCYNLLSPDEARCLLLTCTQRFVDAFNADETIRPYLANFPFAPENFHLSIQFQDSNGDLPLSPWPSSIGTIGGKVAISEWPDARPGSSIMKWETYREAQAKAEKYKSEVGEPGFHLEKTKRRSNSRI